MLGKLTPRLPLPVMRPTRPIIIPLPGPLGNLVLPRLIAPSFRSYILGIDGPDCTDDNFPSSPSGWLDRPDDLLNATYRIAIVNGHRFVAIDFPPQHLAEDNDP